MWALFLCVFPPLFSDEPIDLSTAGATMTTSFHVPVETRYSLDIKFEFPSVDARIRDQIVGDQYNYACRGDIHYEEIPEIHRKGFGRPIPFRIVIRKSSDRSIVFDRTIVSLCITSHIQKEKWRMIGPLPLTTGGYIAEITNLESQLDLVGVKTTIGLYGGHGK